ncbi:helix-turn-helix transcriptional regulator [Jonesiaceae bacterium BS-20]|uniref:Helix-turn-helix transcriptional regulator n=1 Tax=Jonesiaceae bacterium BS-20 TaxID=3120821 RepID=A0AAU7DYH7_9MICO
MKELRVLNAVKIERARRGDMTQTALAQAVGVTRQTMNLIEAQKFNPTIKVCLQIAAVLEVSIEKLFWIAGEDE